MQPFETVTGCAVPLLEANLDTDVIIPIQALVGTGREGLGRHAFARRRYRPDGTENPDFPPNQPPFRDSPILLAAENFGCGSSREGAVWALMGMGVRCVIAPSFGDIFAANALQNGLLPVRLPMEAVRLLAAQTLASPGNARTTVDLARLVVTGPDGAAHPFALDARKRAALLAGLDDISQTLRQAPAIAVWTKGYRARTPWA